MQYDTANLIQKVVEAIKTLDKVLPPKIVVTKTGMDISSKGVTATVSGVQTQAVSPQRITLPDVIANIQAKVELSASTILAIVRQSGKLDEILVNSQAFIDNAAREINTIKCELMVAGVEYIQVAGEYYEMRCFELDQEFERYLSDLQPLENNEKTIYEYAEQSKPDEVMACVEVDSNSTPERDFANACDKNDDILFYLKLPGWFKINTPVGTYNPDWALMYRNDELLYFVAETKDNASANNLNLLRPLERLKIESGKKYFNTFESIAFKVVGDLESLLL